MDKIKKKKIFFSVEFIDNRDVEEVVRGLLNCLNTSTSKVAEIRQKINPPNKEE